MFLMEKQKNFKDIHKSPMDFTTPIGSPTGSMKDYDQLGNEDPFEFDFTRELVNNKQDIKIPNDYESIRSLGSMQGMSLKSGVFANQKKYDTIRSNEQYGMGSIFQVEKYLNNSNPNFQNPEYFLESQRNVDPNLRNNANICIEMNSNNDTSRNYSNDGNFNI